MLAVIAMIDSTQKGFQSKQGHYYYPKLRKRLVVELKGVESDIPDIFGSMTTHLTPCFVCSIPMRADPQSHVYEKLGGLM